MYNTANTLEDLDIKDELLSFDTVLVCVTRMEIWDDEYRDADFMIYVRDNSDLEKIKNLLLPLGFKAYIDDDETVTKLE